MFLLLKNFTKNCILIIENQQNIIKFLAVQTQAGWSFAEDVNFLVSGYNRPFSGSTGSGIYLGKLNKILK